MTTISEKCDNVLGEILQRFHATGKLVHTTNAGNVTDYVFLSDNYRRAHISVVDARDTHKLWLLHVTVFPLLTDSSPIYGFDIVAGPNKVSGAFHDFSPVRKTNKLAKWFHRRTKDLEWNKRRQLPEWAEPIFSKDIVAIGAVGLDELNQFADLGIETLDHYLDMLNLETGAGDYTKEHNFYCTQQRQNPHTARVLQTLGFTETEAQAFVDDTLFPLVV